MKTTQIIKDKELIKAIKSLAKTLGIQCKGKAPSVLQTSIEEALCNNFN
jgi:hypothetical protein